MALCEESQTSGRRARSTDRPIDRSGRFNTLVWTCFSTDPNVAYRLLPQLREHIKARMRRALGDIDRSNEPPIDRSTDRFDSMFLRWTGSQQAQCSLQGTTPAEAAQQTASGRHTRSTDRTDDRSTDRPIGTDRPIDRSTDRFDATPYFGPRFDFIPTLNNKARIRSDMLGRPNERTTDRPIDRSTDQPIVSIQYLTLDLVLNRP